MAKKRGNPNWGKPDAGFSLFSGPTSFEQVVRKLRLSPAEYENSFQLKMWVEQNRNHKYVPPDLLKAWKIDVRDDS